MARRHLGNPREGEGKGHGRDRRELRALRQRVRDLEAQIAAQEVPEAGQSQDCPETSGPGSSPRTPHGRPAGGLRRMAAWLRQLWQRHDR